MAVHFYESLPATVRKYGGKRFLVVSTKAFLSSGVKWGCSVLAIFAAFVVLSGEERTVADFLFGMAIGTGTGILYRLIIIVFGRQVSVGGGRLVVREGSYRNFIVNVLFIDRATLIVSPNQWVSLKIDWDGRSLEFVGTEEDMQIDALRTELGKLVGDEDTDIEFSVIGPRPDAM